MLPTELELAIQLRVCRGSQKVGTGPHPPAHTLPGTIQTRDQPERHRKDKTTKEKEQHPTILYMAKALHDPKCANSYGLSLQGHARFPSSTVRQNVTIPVLRISHRTTLSAFMGDPKATKTPASYIPAPPQLRFERP